MVRGARESHGENGSLQLEQSWVAGNTRMKTLEGKGQASGAPGLQHKARF